MKRAVAALLLASLPLVTFAQERLVVFAAASLRNALDEINALYAEESKARVVVSYAASSALARQIESGAPAQVFISADLDWMDYLEKKTFIRSASRRNLLTNRLVLLAPSGSSVQASDIRDVPFATILGPSGRLALGDPQHVPAGKYARAALQGLGLWDSLAPRVAAADNVRGALAMVARGEAPLGIVYETDARAEPKTRVVATIDPALHPPVIYPIALVRDAGGAAPTEYLRFLAAARARSVFVKHGFTPLD